MPLPNNQEFESILSSLTFEPLSDDQSSYRSQVIIPELSAVDVNGAVTLPERTIWYKPSKITLDSLLKRISQELDQKEHFSDSYIILSMLGLFTLRRDLEKSAVNTFNLFLDRICDATVSQVFLFPDVPTLNFSFSIGPFQFQRLDEDKMAYRCKKAKSDYFTRWHHSLKRRMSIERELFITSVVDWFVDPDNSIQRLWATTATRTLYEELIVFYFEQISRNLETAFWNQLLEEQHILIAAGAPYIDERELRKLMWTDMICIYMGVGPHKAGFVSPRKYGPMTIDLANVNIRVPTVRSWLSKEYSFEQFKPQEVHQTLQTYSKFLSKAERHLIDGRTDEGFLHFIIALDLVFGEKDSSTKSVSNRVAALVHRSFGKKYPEQVKSIQKLYDARSRYVHAGESITEDLIIKGKSICNEVLFSLLRLQHPSKKDISVRDWLTNLDYIIAATEAGQSLDNTFLEQNGISFESPVESNSKKDV